LEAEQELRHLKKRDGKRGLRQRMKELRRGVFSESRWGIKMWLRSHETLALF